MCAVAQSSGQRFVRFQKRGIHIPFSDIMAWFIDRDHRYVFGQFFSQIYLDLFKLGQSLYDLGAGIVGMEHAKHYQQFEVYRL